MTNGSEPLKADKYWIFNTRIAVASTIMIAMFVLMISIAGYLIIRHDLHQLPTTLASSLENRIDQVIQAKIDQGSLAVAPPSGGGGIDVTTTIGLQPGLATTTPDAVEVSPSGNSGPSTQVQASQNNRPPQIHARWTQLIPPSKACGAQNAFLADGSAADCTPRILVRAIIDEMGDCSKVVLRLHDGTSYPMNARERFKKEGFQVQVCETLLSLDRREGHQEVDFADGGTLSWKGLLDIKTIAVVGDTGCDPKNGQRCDGTASWRFQDIAKNAADIGGASDRATPDLVIHVGDYRYRGDDDWDNWREDFFKPAEPLLRAAPWIMARGNHESCHGNQGPGWFYFLQPENHYVSKCPRLGGEDESDNLPPYAVDLGPQGPNADAPPRLRLVVLDSTYAKYQCKRWADEWSKAPSKDSSPHATRFKSLMEASNAKDTWIVTHYPIWDVAAHLVSGDNTDLNKYLHCEGEYDNAKSVHKYRKLATSAIAVLPMRKRPTVVLSGDTHHFQILRVHDYADSGQPSENSEHPIQFVAGHGGTLLTPGLGASGPQPDLLTEDTCERPDHHHVAYFQRKVTDFGGNGSYWVLGKAVCEYGSLRAIYGSDGWTFDLVTVSGSGGKAPTKCLPGISGGSSCYHDRERDHYCVKLGDGADRQCAEFAGKASLSP